MKVVDIGNTDKPLMTTTQLKQFLEFMAIQAQINWSYFNDLKGQGFSEHQALEIVKHFKVGG
jgi:hypothetical protein